ncbi:MAG: hypothetical protein COB02_09070 [Candidatus Cloacimonadota bacterium]|nr:MAG: hypothetical protein COB02_09070 [Candidatus Cloacimonadota bacterium]
MGLDVIDFEDLKKYLPQYLSNEAQGKLFSELKNFPTNMDGRMFTSTLEEEENWFQGDGVFNVPCIGFPDETVRKRNSLILSNTCDMSKENTRKFPIGVSYIPIVKLAKYEAMLLNMDGETDNTVSSHISTIKKQKFTHIFYLPKHGKLEEDSIVFFDKISNASLKYFEEMDLKKDRIFTLSDYGFYLFLFKLSIHFTRVQEKVDRGMIEL